MNLGIVIQGGAGLGAVAAAGVGILGEIVTGIAVTAENFHITSI